MSFRFLSRLNKQIKILSIKELKPRIIVLDMLLLVLLCFTTSQAVVFDTYHQITNFEGEMVKEIFKLFFPIQKFVCFICDPNSTNIDLLIAHIGRSIVILEISDPKTASERRLHHCEGYIVGATNLNPLKNILSNVSQSKQFMLPHRTIIFLHPGPIKVHFEELLGIYALNVIEFEVHFNPDLKRYYRIINFDNGEVLFQWNSSEKSYLIDREKFVRKEWNPDNLFKRNNYTFRFAVFNCDPFFNFDKTGNISGGLEMNLAREMIEGFPVQFVYVDNRTGIC